MCARSDHRDNVTPSIAPRIAPAPRFIVRIDCLSAVPSSSIMAPSATPAATSARAVPRRRSTATRRCTWRSSTLPLDQARGELRAGADVQLAVDLPERGLDGAHAEEQGCGGLLVGEPRRHPLGDAPLGVGQLPRRAHAAADPATLRPGLLCPDRGAEAGELRQRVVQRATGLAAPTQAALQRP